MNRRGFFGNVFKAAALTAIPPSEKNQPEKAVNINEEGPKTNPEPKWYTEAYAEATGIRTQFTTSSTLVLRDKNYSFRMR